MVRYERRCEAISALSSIDFLVGFIQILLWDRDADERSAFDPIEVPPQVLESEMFFAN